MRAAVRGQAELLAISFAERVDLTYASDQEMEKAYVQYVSGRTSARSDSGPPWGGCSPKTTISSQARIRTPCSLMTIGYDDSDRTRQ